MTDEPTIALDPPVCVAELRRRIEDAVGELRRQFPGEPDRWRKVAVAEIVLRVLERVGRVPDWYLPLVGVATWAVYREGLDRLTPLATARYLVTCSAEVRRSVLAMLPYLDSDPPDEAIEP